MKKPWYETSYISHTTNSFNHRNGNVIRFVSSSTSIDRNGKKVTRNETVTQNPDGSINRTFNEYNDKIYRKSLR